MSSHATLAQLAGYLYGDESMTASLPQDAHRLIQRAGECVEDYTAAAVYDVDDAGSPTRTSTALAFRKAVCAQVEFWLAGDEEDDVLGPLASMTAGSGSQDMGAARDRTTPMYLAPRAARALRAEGLLNGAIGS